MMPRYIDAEKLAFEPDEHGGANGVLILERRNGKTMRLVLTALKKMVEGLPTEDVEPVKHGHWIDMQENEATEGMWRCSECGSDRYFDIMTPTECGCYYCPNCGAKMDGERRTDGEKGNH